MSLSSAVRRKVSDNQAQRLRKGTWGHHCTCGGGAWGQPLPETSERIETRVGLGINPKVHSKIMTKNSCPYVSKSVRAANIEWAYSDTEYEKVACD